MSAKKLDTRAIGLDVGLKFSKWLTGAENLHYGDWTDLAPTAANVGPAQEAYTQRLFKLLDNKPLRILDIGGGAGETAKKLLELGHTVDIVIPSAFLAERCCQNAPGATVHEVMFEDFETNARFDVCLFSESYQYIPLDQGLSKCLALLNDTGTIIISDCFRTPEFSVDDGLAKVGGGHPIEDFRALLAASPVDVVSEQNITSAVAPSVDIEQGLFNVLGYGMTRVDQELALKRKRAHWLLHRALRMFLSQRRRIRLDQRLNQATRTSENFIKYNSYLMMKLSPSAR